MVELDSCMGTINNPDGSVLKIRLIVNRINKTVTIRSATLYVFREDRFGLDATELTPKYIDESKYEYWEEQI